MAVCFNDKWTISPYEMSHSRFVSSYMMICQFNCLTPNQRGFSMNFKEFNKYRHRLKKTKQEMAQLLGMSESSLSSYEKDYRSVPAHVERQMFFLLSKIEKNRKNRKPCWIIKKCSHEIREKCPTWEFKEEDFCWLINGTFYYGNACKDLSEKMKFCRSCEVLKSFL